MKLYFILFVSVLIFISSCNQEGQPESRQTNTSHTIENTPLSSTNTFSEFNLEQIPVSSQEIGEFPYISAPAGYKHADEKKKTLEEKYFFYSDSLIRKVSGQYFHTTVYQEGNVFEDTYLVGEYDKVIKKMGGVQFYSGGLPFPAAELIEKENPTYTNDMYDPRPYKYKQYLVRTPKENIWIELCHGLNANQIDLTILKEDLQERGEE